MGINVPKDSYKLNFVEHVKLRQGVTYQRVIDPRTGKQFEISSHDVVYTCPICKLEQAGPVARDIEYACPKCKWRYKIYPPTLLVIWNPIKVGVKTKAFPPGADPDKVMLDKAVDQTEPEAVDEEYAKSKKTFFGALANQEDEQKAHSKIQVVKPKDTT
jgi:hypothetical protein